MQFIEQHWVSAVHDWPSALQPPGPHTPPLQAWLQQADAAVHALPLAVQVGPPLLLLVVVVPLLLDVVPLLVAPVELEALVLEVCPPPPSFPTSGCSAPEPQPLPSASANPASAGIIIRSSGRCKDVRMVFSAARRAARKAR